MPNLASTSQEEASPAIPPRQPIREERNRKPEELDALAAELNHLASGGQLNPPGVEDDDSDEENTPARDGTLLASEPPRPL